MIAAAENFMFDEKTGSVTESVDEPPTAAQTAAAEGFNRQRVSAVRVTSSRLCEAAWYERDYTKYRFESSMTAPAPGALPDTPASFERRFSEVRICKQWTRVGGRGRSLRR